MGINDISKIIEDALLNLGFNDSLLWEKLPDKIKHHYKIDPYCNCNNCINSFLNLCFTYYDFPYDEIVSLKLKFIDDYSNNKNAYEKGRL